MIFRAIIIFSGLILGRLGVGANTTTTFHRTSSPERSGRVNLFSFRPLGKDVAMGLDFELPFLQVPMKQYKDKYGNSPAMVNINTGSLVISGLLAGGSLFVAHIIRSLNVFQAHTAEGESESVAVEKSNGIGEGRQTKKTMSKDERSSNVEDYTNDARSLLEHFKLVYKNGTGERVETTLPSLLAHIAETFSDNDVDIAACVQKSICLWLQKSSKDVHQGRATSLQKIIDGVSSYGWLLDALVPYEDLRRAIKAGKIKSDTSCVLAYPACRWSTPDMRLAELIRTHVNFV
ncbi:uncharacterized protein LOC118736766 isoform X2 [Rhagoletis pomonella]|uniref:uncharacterized protein LOC118736766 isoform X2 n=1 Tax=Rhagoletis pomonella TaxID=28610 RepID=UPI0017860B2B|nr:uncharacterized protein LOC118736766 isoform X2 [Rhagoletis pomonella]